MVCEKWLMKNGQWKMVNEKWLMKNVSHWDFSLVNFSLRLQACHLMVPRYDYGSLKQHEIEKVDERKRASVHTTKMKEY